MTRYSPLARRTRTRALIGAALIGVVRALYGDQFDKLIADTSLKDGGWNGRTSRYALSTAQSYLVRELNTAMTTAECDALAAFTARNQ